MHPARIAELLEPFLGPTLNPCHSEPGQRRGEEPALVSPADGRWPTTADLNNISTYIDILLRWNARINLTAIRNQEEIVTRHFGESLFAARHLFPSSSASSASSALNAFDVADLGAGAGFPGIPIKLYAPHVRLTLIESNHKKATFLREIARALTLTDIDILTARAESLTTHYNVVTLRAVERFETILSVAARLVAPSGRLALLIGSIQSAQALSLLPAFAWSAPIPIPLSTSRFLLIATGPNI